jgi:GNAT superfamily N-acetyltransferase
MNKIKIRTATLTDTDELSDLLSILFTQESDFAANTEKQITGLLLIIENPVYGHILLAKSDDQICGMVNLLYTISTAEGARAAILEDMIVHPDFRGSGVGTLLIEEAISFLRSQGISRITLLTDSVNEKAIRFYTRFGFHKSEMIPLRLHIQ